MRLPVGLLVISGMVVCMYLFGLLVAYKHRQVTRIQSEEDQQKQQQEMVQPDSDFYVESRATLTLAKATSDLLRQKIECDRKQLRRRTVQRGSFWVLENYVVAAGNRHVNCFETITYTTHTDYTFLDNLVPVVERWGAPVSVALFAPGDDFRNVADSIFWMRNCLDNERHMALIRELVSFHIYFNASHMPTGDVTYLEEGSSLDKCSDNPMIRESFKSKNKLFYPVNVGRNVARNAAATYFVFPSDIELYPSPNIVPKFLHMIANEPGNKLPPRRIFPIAIYEVAENATVPNTKTELVEMLKTKQAQRFHASICKTCHSVPQNDKWESTPESSEMRIFTEIKRTGQFHHWEPIYIGTQDDPYYDERLSWEGKSDKMTQGYLLCALDYTMALLSDAFLTHRPGFKKYSDAVRPKLEKETFEVIRKVIGPELYKIYGKRDGCNL